MNRREFLSMLAAAAGGLVLPEPRRVRAYSFMPGRLWEARDGFDVFLDGEFYRSIEAVDGEVKFELPAFVSRVKFGHRSGRAYVVNLSCAAAVPLTMTMRVPPTTPVGHKTILL